MTADWKTKHQPVWFGPCGQVSCLQGRNTFACSCLHWAHLNYLVSEEDKVCEGLFTRLCYCQVRIARCFSGRFSCRCCLGPGLWWVSSGCWCCPVVIQPLASCLSLSSMQQLDTKQLDTPCSSKCRSNDLKRTHQLLTQILLFLLHLLHFSCEQILIYKNFLFVVFSVIPSIFLFGHANFAPRALFSS